MNQDRRTFLKNIGRLAVFGLMATGAGKLMFKEEPKRKSAGTCIADGICRDCGQVKDCGQPQAMSFRQTKK